MIEDDYILLIYKELEGEITSDEQTMLNDWVAEAAENAQTKATISEIWSSSTPSAPEINVDLDHEFSRLTERIFADKEKEASLKEETPVISLVKRKRKTWMVAASIAVLVGLGSAWFAFNKSGDEIALEVTKTLDQQKEIQLADGSKIYLNKNSSLTFPKEFRGDKREVELEGEAFFEIAKDPSHPFIVHTAYHDVTVLGTSFNVSAYSNEDESHVSVVTGKVQVATEKGKEILNPSEKVIVQNKSGELTRSTAQNSNDAFWHTQTITFMNTRAEEVFDELAHYYQLSFDLSESNINDCLFTSTFKNEKLDVILESIAVVLNVEIVQKDKTKYKVIGGSCL